MTSVQRIEIERLRQALVKVGQHLADTVEPRQDELDVPKVKDLNGRIDKAIEMIEATLAPRKEVPVD